MTRYHTMTPEERADFRARYEVQAEHQRTIKAREAALDEILAYLKATRRTRTAPTMLYQYPGFLMDEFQRLVQQLEKAQSKEDEAHERVMAAFRPRQEA